MWHPGLGGARGLQSPRDRTLEELDTAIAATEGTAKKADAIVKEKQARATAAATRKKNLVAVLNSACDECATIPCLLLALGAASNVAAACVVCGDSIDPVNVMPESPYAPRRGRDGQDRALSASELGKELASHMGSASRPVVVKIGAIGADPRTAQLQAPTRQQMLKEGGRVPDGGEQRAGGGAPSQVRVCQAKADA